MLLHHITDVSMHLIKFLSNLPHLVLALVFGRPFIHYVCTPSLGEGPDPAEVFTIVRVSENRIALKTGYDRYVSVNSAGELIGRTEALGPREMWEPVFDDVSLRQLSCC